MRCSLSRGRNRSAGLQRLQAARRKSKRSYKLYLGPYKLYLGSDEPRRSPDRPKSPSGLSDVGETAKGSREIAWSWKSRSAGSGLARAALGDEIPDVPMSKRWVVFCKPTAHGAERVLDYLGRYVHRTALTDHALLHCDEQSVCLSYRDSTTNERKQMTLPALEFVGRYLQHVPFEGLHRVRAFGLLHPASRANCITCSCCLVPSPARR